MRYLLRVCNFALLVVLLLQLFPSVCALELNLGFDTIPMAAEETAEYIKNIDMELLAEEIKGNSVACFDVNQNGLYALGFETSPKYIVSIYTADGEFKYGYRFKCSGAFAVELSDHNNLTIYFNRGDLVATFDDSAQCVHMASIPISISNMDHIYEVIDVTHKTEGERTYYLDRGIPIGSSYSRFLVVDEQGVETILYDVTILHNIRVIFACLLFAAFAFFFIYRVIRQQITQKM